MGGGWLGREGHEASETGAESEEGMDWGGEWLSREGRQTGEKYLNICLVMGPL